MARKRFQVPRSTLLTVFWRCLPCGALVPGTFYLTFRLFFPGSVIWTVSVLNARKSNGQRTIESRQNMIKLKRVYESTGKDDSKKFLVERLWPRGVKKTALADAIWLKDVAPSNELRKWFGHDPEKWAEFQHRYQAEIKEHEPARAYSAGCSTRHCNPALQLSRH